jgi:decaprenylphospho-beta-D-erythro-pentofuranosid-2-ulose 2-reductase
MSKGPVLILGGRSDIGLAVAHQFAAARHPIQLAARNAEGLAAEKSNIELRYNVPVSLHEFDALDISSHERFVRQIELPEIAVCAVGVLGDQAKNERNLQAATMVIRSNYEGPASIMAVLANSFENRGSGTLVGISSVAGDRGRASNYIYGSAKAGLTAFLSGLRNRLAKKGVHVITVKLGFVATKMVEGIDLPAKLTAKPEEVAAAIEKAVSRKRSVIYVKPFWAVIMMVVRNIPEALFKTLKI